MMTARMQVLELAGRLWQAACWLLEVTGLLCWTRNGPMVDGSNSSRKFRSRRVKADEGLGFWHIVGSGIWNQALLGFWPSISYILVYLAYMSYASLGFMGGGYVELSSRDGHARPDGDDFFNTSMWGIKFVPFLSPTRGNPRQKPGIRVCRHPSWFSKFRLF